MWRSVLSVAGPPELVARATTHLLCSNFSSIAILTASRSSRRLEREAGRNVELMWLLGRLVPDHKTIAYFRRDNGAAIRRTCA